jgi:lipopolysaccharide/colanic/teichoic acid biosynthesis glycosyltransferase
MVADASSRGGQLTCGADPRVTRVGRILRKTKIDELPQLVNVLRGEMSLVGPRPEVPRYVELFKSEYEEILRVQPGMTDLASIQYVDESSILQRAEDPEREYVTTVLPEKIALAKQYVARSSLSFDLSLILRTLLKIVTR